MAINNIKHNIRQLRMERHLTLQEFAKLINDHAGVHSKLNHAVVSSWERANGSYPSLRYLKIISEYFNVSIDELVYAPNMDRVINTPATKMEETIQIPVINEINQADYRYIDKKHATEYRSVLKKYATKGELFYTKVADNAMLPIIPINSYLLCREDVAYANNDIVCVLNIDNHQIYTRKYYEDGGDVLLLPTNDQYHPFILNVTFHGKVLGKVVNIDLGL